MSAVELRPDTPDLSGSLVFADPRPGFARCRLRVDLGAGTASWLGDGRSREPVDLSIGDGPGELAAVLRLVHPRNFWFPHDLAGRLLLVDSAGRVLARSRLVQQAVLFQMWPYLVLDACGLPVREVRYRNSRLVQKAHPGAAPSWPFTAGYFWLLLATSVLTSAFVGLMALVVVLTGWSA